MASHSTTRVSGFTLIELMISVAILAIIAAIGLPMYNGYIETSREGVLVNNIQSIQLFQDDVRLRTGAFVVSAANLAAITTATGWEPQDDNGATYVITDPGDGGYRVTATDSTGVSVCIEFPEKDRC